MKTLGKFVIGQAIAVLMTWGFGLTGFIAFLAIILMWFAFEYKLITDFNIGMTAQERKELSLHFVAAHAVNCMITMVIATSLGLFNGYNILVERAVGDNFTYSTAHQGGWIWWLFLVPLFIRVGLEYHIENKLRENEFLYWSE